MIKVKKMWRSIKNIHEMFGRSVKLLNVARCTAGLLGWSGRHVGQLYESCLVRYSMEIVLLVFLYWNMNFVLTDKIKPHEEPWTLASRSDLLSHECCPLCQIPDSVMDSPVFLIFVHDADEDRLSTLSHLLSSCVSAHQCEVALLGLPAPLQTCDRNRREVRGRTAAQSN